VYNYVDQIKKKFLTVHVKNS